MRTRKWLQPILLLALGLYFLNNMLSGHIYFYINERFGWLSWLATGMFLLLGLIGVWELIRTPHMAAVHTDDHHEHDHDEAHNHDYDHSDHEHHHDHELEALHDHAGHSHA